MVYMDQFNDKEPFDEDIYPPYSNIAKDIENLPKFVNTRSEFKILRVFIKRIYEELDRVEQYISYRDYRSYRWSIYAALDKIKDLTKAMDERIGEIKIKIHKLPNDRETKVFEYYINRIQLEIIEPLMMDADDLEHYIEQGYDISNELINFIRGARVGLKELENIINEVLNRT